MLMRDGMPRRLAAATVGVHPSTLARWKRRNEDGRRLARPRGPDRVALQHQVAQAVELVRDLKGLVGAEALRHSVPGLSRRLAASIKAETCRAMERERKKRVERITIATPGLLRGFDAMVVGRQYLFIAGDGSVPYRTSWSLEPHYTGHAVARFLGNDLRRHGAPLVLRMDRARQHLTASVRRVLDRHQILVLHGPPHRPAYYGQLERQNEEHRKWLARAEAEPVVPATLAAMIDALNGKWRRRELGWMTAAEAWAARPKAMPDRTTFQREVEDSARRIREEIDLRGKPADLPWRLAIEQTLARHRFMVRKIGGWC
jgi:hypothetical protein